MQVDTTTYDVCRHRQAEHRHLVCNCQADRAAQIGTRCRAEQTQAAALALMASSRLISQAVVALLVDRL